MRQQLPELEEAFKWRCPVGVMDGMPFSHFCRERQSIVDKKDQLLNCGFGDVPALHVITIGIVVTLTINGSEMNAFAVFSNGEDKLTINRNYLYRETGKKPLGFLIFTSLYN
jgi:hypothetical protein